ncbi:hypothetical protein HMPREF9709_01422 [Helcococcus kunzii ATCC 51366]|uniref:Uncharacterized protein n=1 Tax=Helcococcus kunzii ATCC 51366 TaxID=883114 RepID=H3NQ11_9FIRM|nr:hypothetical protein [Helcococcus kunzii]EHR32691.1 hypothetical protein HMPREF9709_01422 [Helcococcus kunzii ATCC 51366]
MKKGKEIKEIALMIGTQGDGFTDNIVKFDGEKVFRTSDNFMQHMYDEGELKLDKKKFLKEFNKINVEEWDDSYVVFNRIYGYSWELNVFYENGDKLIKKGSNDYPENMSDLLHLLEVEFVVDRLDQNQED